MELAEEPFIAADPAEFEASPAPVDAGGVEDGSVEKVDEGSPISSRYFAYDSCSVVSLVFMAASRYLATTAVSVKSESEVATELCFE